MEVGSNLIAYLCTYIKTDEYLNRLRLSGSLKTTYRRPIKYLPPRRKVFISYYCMHLSFQSFSTNWRIIVSERPKDVLGRPLRQSTEIIFSRLPNLKRLSLTSIDGRKCSGLSISICTESNLRREKVSNCKFLDEKKKTKLSTPSGPRDGPPFTCDIYWRFIVSFLYS